MLCRLKSTASTNYDTQLLGMLPTPCALSAKQKKETWPFLSTCSRNNGDLLGNISTSLLLPLPLTCIDMDPT